MDFSWARKCAHTLYTLSYLCLNYTNRYIPLWPPPPGWESHFKKCVMYLTLGTLDKAELDFHSGTVLWDPEEEEGDVERKHSKWSLDPEDVTPEKSHFPTLNLNLVFSQRAGTLRFLAILHKVWPLGRSSRKCGKKISLLQLMARNPQTELSISGSDWAIKTAWKHPVHFLFPVFLLPLFHEPIPAFNRISPPFFTQSVSPMSSVEHALSS